MALEKISVVRGHAVCVPGDDIDTDRIIPARFMKCVTFDGLGEYAFADAREAAQASGQVHPLDDPRFQGVSILVSGSNFGCGSSREHAPQALYRFGFRAVIASSFAEIFFGNSITLGMPCVSMTPENLEKLSQKIEEDPTLEVTLDLEANELTLGDLSLPIQMPPHAREALISGRWDAIADLLEGLDAVQQTASRLPYMASNQ